MRIAIVNHTHPVSGHVSALRMARFADELAKLGNTVLLITQAPTQPDDSSRQDIGASFAKLVAGLSPVLIECQLESAVLAGAARSGRLPFGLRQLVIGGCYAFTGGIFPCRSRPSGQVYANRGFRERALIEIPSCGWPGYGRRDINRARKPQ